MLSQQAQPQRTDDAAVNESTHHEFRHNWRIASIFIVLVFLSFLSALDSSIITTSLPTITHEIGGEREYTWIVNSYLFASTVPQPLFGQIANVFGRRTPFFVSLGLFFLGSALAGFARNAAMFIAARVIQGVGSGGLYVLPEIIMCDLVPPRHRGPYLSALLSAAAIGATIGPIIGGVLAQADWRWIFWINLPVVAVGIVFMIWLLRLKHTRNQTWKAALSRVDFLGNAIFIPSIISIFFGLILGGNSTSGYPWDNWRIILSLVLGVFGWIVFHIHQASPICREPSMPPRLFKHRTSSVGFLMIFLISTFSQAIAFFIPIYFQAVRGTSPLVSGVNYLPFALALLVLAGSAGGFLSKTGLYKPVHFAGWALSAIGAGLFSMLDEDSNTETWAGFQILAAGGVGFIFTVSLPSTLSALEEGDVAVATGTFAFVRTFGFVWGVTMASIIFNSQVNSRLDTIDDPLVRQYLADGAAYAYAAGREDGSGSISGLSETSRSQVISIYVQALRTVWLTYIGISCVGLLSTFIEKQLDLRREHETQFGLAENEATQDKPDQILDLVKQGSPTRHISIHDGNGVLEAEKRV